MATLCRILAWETHGQRSLVGYCPWGCKQSDMTDATKHSTAHRYTSGHRINFYFYFFLNCSSFIHVFIQQTSDTYCVSGTVLDFGKAELKR